MTATLVRVREPRHTCLCFGQLLVAPAKSFEDKAVLTTTMIIITTTTILITRHCESVDVKSSCLDHHCLTTVPKLTAIEKTNKNDKL